MSHTCGIHPATPSASSNLVFMVDQRILVCPSRPPLCCLHYDYGVAAAAAAARNASATSAVSMGMEMEAATARVEDEV